MNPKEIENINQRRMDNAKKRVESIKEALKPIFTEEQIKGFYGIGGYEVLNQLASHLPGINTLITKVAQTYLGDKKYKVGDIVYKQLSELMKAFNPQVTGVILSKINHTYEVLRDNPLEVFSDFLKKTDGVSLIHLMENFSSALDLKKNHNITLDDLAMLAKNGGEQALKDFVSLRRPGQPILAASELLDRGITIGQINVLVKNITHANNPKAASDAIYDILCYLPTVDELEKQGMHFEHLIDYAKNNNISTLIHNPDNDEADKTLGKYRVANTINKLLLEKLYTPISSKLPSTAKDTDGIVGKYISNIDIAQTLRKTREWSEKEKSNKNPKNDMEEKGKTDPALANRIAGERQRGKRTASLEGR